MMQASSLDSDMLILLILFVGTSALLMVIAIPLMLRRIPPNALYGFRTPQTLRNPELWYEINAYAGRRLLVAGGVGVVAAIALYGWPGWTVDAYALVYMAVVVSLLTATLIQSLRRMKSLGKGKDKPETRQNG